MTSRERFERWALRRKLDIDVTYEVTRDGPRRQYVNAITREAWAAWVAALRLGHK